MWFIFNIFQEKGKKHTIHHIISTLDREPAPLQIKRHRTEQQSRITCNTTTVTCEFCVFSISSSLFIFPYHTCVCVCARRRPVGYSFHRSHLRYEGPTRPTAYCVCERVGVCERVCVCLYVAAVCVCVIIMVLSARCAVSRRVFRFSVAPKQSGFLSGSDDFDLNNNVSCLEKYFTSPHHNLLYLSCVSCNNKKRLSSGF